MSLRAIWILNHVGENSGKLVFSRTFPTVERRALRIEGSHYVPVPPHHQVADLLTAQLGLKITQFVDVRDSCRAPNEKPVYQIKTPAGDLWPLLVIEQYGLLFCCLPLVEDGAYNRPPILNILGLSLGFSLLLCLADFLGPQHKVLDETSTKLGELSLLLNLAAPFGTPCDVNINSLRAVLFGHAPPPSSIDKQPAWKPYPHKGKTQVSFLLTEQIRAVQYDKPEIPDVWDVYGTVVCKADIEGALPELCVTLAQESDKIATPLERLIMHPCVTTYAENDSSTHGGGRTRTISIASYTSSTTMGSRRSSLSSLSSVQQLSGEGVTFHLNPPPETFTLCHYTANVAELPIKGFYQMKGENMVELLIQLKLSERIKNNFEVCEVHIPFFHRGPVVKHEFPRSTHGNISLGRDKKSLVWNVGQKFPGNLEVLLKATVHFKEYKVNKTEDLFCIGQNSFIRMYFKLTEFTQTSCCVDSRRVHTVPPSKFKATSAREYVTSDYTIWNSHGDVKAAYTPSLIDLY